MDLIDRLEKIAKRIPKQLEHINTEEATKTALVMPFLSALGYDVFDPTEVVPEFTADVGIKKGEKVDYAIMNEGSPAILIECKAAGTDLNTKHASQLYRYFSVTEARIAVLTDGIVYKFYSDLDDSNRMDDVPFLELDMLDLTDELVQELKLLTKDRFDLDSAIEAANELKFTKAIKQVFHKNLQEPEDDFVRYFVSVIEPERRIVQSTKDFYRPLIAKALKLYISERVSGRLTAALAQEELEVRPAKLSEVSSANEANLEEAAEATPDAPDDGIVTTDEEIEGFHIVRAIMSERIDPERVIMRDVKSYCGVLLDDNNRQPICRLHFNTSQNYIGLFDAEKNETKVAIERLADIYKHRKELLATVDYYDAVEEFDEADDDD